MDGMTDIKQIRVLTVDDHPLMRRGIAGEVNEQPDMKVVAEAVDGKEAVVAFRAHRPDVTLMDLRLPEASGIEAMIDIRKEFPEARFIVLTTVAGDNQVVRAFAAGARGYLLKNLLRTELVETIRAVHAGKKKVPPEVAQLLADHFTEDDLTQREVEILQGVAKGYSNKIVADHLNISENTVKNHVKSILSKLGASDRTHAVVIALQRGIIES
jgi:DNA-binding NarL/FixJ family response regulator